MCKMQMCTKLSSIRSIKLQLNTEAQYCEFKFFFIAVGAFATIPNMNSVSLRRLLQFFSFRMHTWHTINGENVIEISVRLLGVVFADMERKFLTQIMSIILRVSSLIVTGLFMANLFFAHNIEEFAKIFEGVMIGLQVSDKSPRYPFSKLSKIKCVFLLS